MRNQKQTQEIECKKVGPCLYRYRGGNYYAIFKVSGRQRKVCLDTNDLALARRKLVTVKEEGSKTDPGARGMTIDDMAGKYLDALTLSTRTRHVKTREIRDMLRDWPTPAPRILSKIKKSDILSWLGAYDKLRSSTVNSYITLARQMFQLAVDDRAIPANPAESIKYRKRGVRKDPTPTYEQFKEIVAHLRSVERHNPHGRGETADYIEFMGEAGLGQAEIAGLRLQDVDLPTGRMSIFRRKTTTSFSVPIYPNARPILEHRMAGEELEQTSRLFPFDDCKKALDAACKRLRMAHFTPRSLRRMFISRALMLGVDVQTVSRWQGHQDGGALLLKTYADVLKGTHETAQAAKLGPLPENVISLRGAA